TSPVCPWRTARPPSGPCSKRRRTATASSATAITWREAVRTSSVRPAAFASKAWCPSAGGRPIGPDAGRTGSRSSGGAGRGGGGGRSVLARAGGVGAGGGGGALFGGVCTGGPRLVFAGKVGTGFSAED